MPFFQLRQKRWGIKIEGTRVRQHGCTLLFGVFPRMSCGRLDEDESFLSFGAQKQRTIEMRDAEPPVLTNAVSDGDFLDDFLDELERLVTAHFYSGYTDVATVRGLDRALQKLTKQQVFADIAYSYFIEKPIAARVESLAILHEKLSDFKAFFCLAARVLS